MKRLGYVLSTITFLLISAPLYAVKIGKEENKGRKNSSPPTGTTLTQSVLSMAKAQTTTQPETPSDEQNMQIHETPIQQPCVNDNNNPKQAFSEQILETQPTESSPIVWDDPSATSLPYIYYSKTAYKPTSAEAFVPNTGWSTTLFGVEDYATLMQRIHNIDNKIAEKERTQYTRRVFNVTRALMASLDEQLYKKNLNKARTTLSELYNLVQISHDKKVIESSVVTNFCNWVKKYLESVDIYKKETEDYINRLEKPAPESAEFDIKKIATRLGLKHNLFTAIHEFTNINPEIATQDTTHFTTTVTNILESLLHKTKKTKKSTESASYLQHINTIITHASQLRIPVSEQLVKNINQTAEQQNEALLKRTKEQIKKRLSYHALLLKTQTDLFCLTQQRFSQEITQTIFTSKTPTETSEWQSFKQSLEEINTNSELMTNEYKDI